MASHLTPRESETLTWVANGKTDWEIGVILGLTRQGIDKRMRSIKKKLGANTRTLVVAEAFRRGLVA